MELAEAKGHAEVAVLLEGLLSALAPPHRAVLVRLLALFRPMATAPSCSQTVRRRRPPCFRFRA